MMKKYIAFILFLTVISHFGYTQFNNEWIDYGKTYYKFLVGKTGTYRISKASLDAIGQTNTQVQHYQLWRNGVEIPIFTSVQTGILPANGYIEFIGEKNDGRPDRAIYRNAAHQLTDKVSLFTDTAAYFLTVNSASANKRFVPLDNLLTGTLPSAASFLWHTVRHDYREGSTDSFYVHKGIAANYGEYVYSSAYDEGEMLSSGDIYIDRDGGDYTNNKANFSQLLPAISSGLNAKIRWSWAGAAPNTRTVEARINGQILKSSSLIHFRAALDSVSTIAPNLLNQPNTIIGFANKSNNLFDRFAVGFVEIEYPRLPDANNADFFQSSLPANTNNILLVLKRFKHDGVNPVLYNTTTGRHMVGSIDANGDVRFLIPPHNAMQHFVVASTSNQALNMVTQVVTRNFKNFAVSANHANYIIISNSRLMTGGNNAIEEYRTYRNSAAGGGFNAGIYEINELVDQFAFGIKFHPLSIKNFLRYARQRFSPTPQFCFLIGKGVTYDEYRKHERNPASAQLQLVPTFGYPASDNMLASNDLQSAYPATPIGRLSVVNQTEIRNYLQKIKEYEAAQANPSVLQADKAWMKNVVHVVGANDANTEVQIRPYMTEYARTISDTLFGARVTTFNKFNSSTASTIENVVLSRLFESGVSLLTYFGHSSATALDYNLDDPSQYNNPGKYPMFLLNGCNAGNFYTFEVPRLQALSTISEKYVLAPSRGAIGLIASTHFGIVSGLGLYSRGFYQSVTSKAYNNYAGKHIQNAVQYMIQTWGSGEYQVRFHTEQQTLHGDPAVKINGFNKPDYSIEQSNIVVNPSFLSIAETNFKTKIYYYNIGKAINDSMVVEVKRQFPPSAFFPNGNTEVVYKAKRKAPLFIDSIELTLPILPERDKGINNIIVTLDQENKIDEISELNNTVTREVVIFADELRPVYPINFAIINEQNTKLRASTANPFSERLTYIMEIDTSEHFTSPLKQSRTVTAPGGIVEFDPGITFRDSTVYYWRLGLQSSTGGAPARWNNSSFIYLAGPQTGFNQSHFYQHLKSTAARMRMDSAQRNWKFNPAINNLFITHSIFPTSGSEDSHFSVSVNNELISTSACVGHSMIVNVFDPVTFTPQRNMGNFGTGGQACTASKNPFNFEWDDRDTANRRSIMRFLDNIPNGSYVVVRKVLDEAYADEVFADQLKADEQYFGAGNSVYHRLKAAGFSGIDSFSRPRTYIFVYKKNDPAMAPVWRLSDGLFDRIQLNLNLPTFDTMGIVTSPLLGPAKKWNTVLWNGKPLDSGVGDRAYMDVIGVNSAGLETPLYRLTNSQTSLNIENVNPQTYPFIRLKMTNIDSVNATPWQLNWWRLYYDPVPEGALAPNILLTGKDTVQQGEIIDFKIAFKNISKTAFDSLKVRISVLNRNNVTTTTERRLKPLAPNDTLTISYPINTKDLPGLNTLYVAVNPDNDQPEQYFFNNFLYKTFFANEDVTDPLLDVTFDGVHILNRDIVSARPHIQIKLKDENPFLMLNDTAGLVVRLKFPNENTPRTYSWNSDTLRFNPPAPGSTDNTATIDFFPTLSDDTEGFEYELSVTGNDRLNNRAGRLEYRVSFQVFNKPMISNLLNYPNPFSTSTAFVFTITGAEVPQEFKIQVLTITGKIVREFTKAELGPLRIGTNITEFKWDGTDMFGQKLANGVYLYRVVSSLDGNKMEQFKLNSGFNQNAQDVTDKFFRKGYGKMVILR